MLNAIIYFISDLHLSLEKRELTRQFLNFLQHQAPKADALYILGDLFDSWIGDDDNTPPNKTIKQHLKALSDSGTSIFMISGNRDFLLGQRFCAETGIQLLADYSVLALNHERVLLCHGDLLCSDDLAYQAFRQKSRNPHWQRDVLSKPLWLRLLAARWYRLRSYWHKRQQAQDIMDVNQQTVVQAMREHQCQTLIHGHTHRPGLHHFQINGLDVQRWVLAQWQANKIEYLIWDGQAFVTSEFKS